MGLANARQENVEFNKVFATSMESNQLFQKFENSVVEKLITRPDKRNEPPVSEKPRAHKKFSSFEA